MNELTEQIIAQLGEAGPEGLSWGELRDVLGRPDGYGQAVKYAIDSKAVLTEDEDGETFLYLARFSTVTGVDVAVHPLTERHCKWCRCPEGETTDRALAQAQGRIMRALTTHGALSPRALGQKFRGAERPNMAPALALLVELGKVERTPDGAWRAVL